MVTPVTDQTCISLVFISSVQSNSIESAGLNSLAWHVPVDHFSPQYVELLRDLVTA
jgi:hypothetical protein